MKSGRPSKETHIRPVKTLFPSFVLIIPLVCLAPVFSVLWAGEYDYEGTKQRLDVAYMYYHGGEYARSRSMTDRLMRKVFGESDTGGLEYPTSITLNLKYLDKLLKDKEGYFLTIPSFTGIAKVIWAATTGYFEVHGEKENKNFVFERDVLITGDSDCFHGRKVTVYYGGIKRMGSYDALKVVIHPNSDAEDVVE